MNYDWLIQPLLTAVLAGIAAFIGAYLQQKARHFATKEDLDNLIDQQRSMTAAVKRVETKITNEMWITQQLWTEKKLFFEKIIRCFHFIAGNCNDVCTAKASYDVELSGKANPVLIQFFADEIEKAKKNAADSNRMLRGLLPTAEIFSSETNNVMASFFNETDPMQLNTVADFKNWEKCANDAKEKTLTIARKELALDQKLN